MPILTNPMGLDYLNISTAAIAAADARFRSILSTGSDEFKKLATSRMRSLRESSRMGGGHGPQWALLFPLCDLLGVPAFKVDSTSFDFFKYYFTYAWDASDEFERTYLFGWLKSGLKDESQLVTLFFELQVAFTYLQHGNVVHMKGWSKEKVRGDLDVFSSNGEYSIEIKTLELSTGLPFDADYMTEAITRLATSLHARGVLAGKSGVQMLLNYKGERQPSRDDLLAQVDKLSEQLNSAALNASTDAFDVRLKPVPRAHVDTAATTGWQDQFAHVTILVNPDVAVLACVATSHDHRFSEKAKAVIKDVCLRQLPPGSRTAIWLQLLGLNDSDGKLTRHLLSLNPAIVQELDHHQSESPGGHKLLALHVCANTVVGDAMQAGKRGIALPMGTLSSSTYAEDCNLYRLSTLGPWRPNATVDMLQVNAKTRRR